MTATSGSCTPGRATGREIELTFQNEVSCFVCVTLTLSTPMPLSAHEYSLPWLVLMTRQIILWHHICSTAYDLINCVAIFQIIGSGCVATL